MNSLYYQQVQLLVRVLPFVAPESCFALKGGTAINLFLRNLPRLSVDIDLAYLPLEERHLALPNAQAAMQRIAQRIEASLPGTKARLQRDKADALRLLVSSAQAQIKIEVSPVLRGTLWTPQERDVAIEVEDEFGFATIPVVSLPDLFGGKLCAALDRQHPRDWFDVMLLLDEDGLTREVFEGFLVYLISHGRPMAELLAPRWKDLKPVFEREFAGMTRDPVTIEALERTRDRLLLTLREWMTDQDIAFLLSLKRGEPNWNLLGLPGVSALPAVRWKLANIERMPPDKKAESLSKLERVLEQWKKDRR